MLHVLVWTVLLVTFGCPVVQAETVHKLAADEAYALLQKDQTIFLLDVRTLPDYQRYRLAAAHLIPVDRFLAREGSAEKPFDPGVLRDRAAQRLGCRLPGLQGVSRSLRPGGRDPGLVATQIAGPQGGALTGTVRRCQSPVPVTRGFASMVQGGQHAKQQHGCQGQ